MNALILPETWSNFLPEGRNLSTEGVFARSVLHPEGLYSPNALSLAMPEAQSLSVGLVYCHAQDRGNGLTKLFVGGWFEPAISGLLGHNFRTRLLSDTGLDSF